MTSLRISTPANEGEYQAAKWLKVQALLDGDELADLLALSSSAELFPLAGLFHLEEVTLSKEAFISMYTSWITQIKQGIIPPDSELRKGSAIAWTEDFEALWLQKVPGDRYLVKPCKPLIQIQVHQMNYSTVDGEFRPMVMSRESIFWGLQFSFPQIYQEPKTQQLLEVEEGPNVELYQALRRWVREHTVATPMMVEGKRKNLPIRIGKRSFSWVNRHPQLLAKNLSVMELHYAS